MTLEADVTRGAKAQRLLEDPLLIEAFEIADKAILDKFKRAQDDEQVVRAKQLHTALTLVRAVLEQAIRDGKIAERTLEDRKRGISYLGDVWRSRMKR